MITIHVFSTPPQFIPNQYISESDITYNHLTPKCMINYFHFLNHHHSYSWERLLKVFPEYISLKKKN